VGAGRNAGWSLTVPAKLNLYLHVGPPRRDGRHPLDSLVAFVGGQAVDRLTFTPDPDSPHLTVTTSWAERLVPVPLPDADNHVVRAWAGMRAAFGLAVPGGRVHLHKGLPVAAGLGGGTADGAGMLRGLAAGLGVGLDHPAVQAAARALGGDGPACLLSQTCVMRADGAEVEAVELGCVPAALLVHAGAACPTGPVYAAFDRRGGGLGFAERSPPVPQPTASALRAVLSATANDLTQAAIDVCPPVAETLAAVQAVASGALVRMAGSGASVFALCDTLAEAEAAAQRLRALRSGWWTAVGPIGAGYG
jgi:4-diphosphocytidyl-2-C-methyl-D-erythritol kinase